MKDSHPLGGISKLWIDQIQLSKRAKERFTATGQECMRFYTGAYDHVYDNDAEGRIYRGKISPKFRTTMNLASDFVRIYTPYLINQVPHKTVSARAMREYPPSLFEQFGEEGMEAYQAGVQADSQKYEVDVTRAELMEDWLNYIGVEGPGGGYKFQGVKAVQESLLKGRGCWLTQPHIKHGSVIAATTAFSPDRLYYDPDVEDYHEASWMAIERCEPYWQLEAKMGLPPGTLKEKQSDEPSGVMVYGEEEKAKKAGKTNDLVTYYQIWSRMGVGHKLSGSGKQEEKKLDKLGTNVFLVVAENCPYPLNVHPDATKGKTVNEISERLKWSGGLDEDETWPITILDYDLKPGDSWPVSPLEPGIGILKTINVILSHLVTRTWKSTRDLILTLKSLEDDIKKWFSQGEDLDVMGLPNVSGQTRIDQLISVFQHPPVNRDQVYILEKLEDVFRRTTFLTDIQYGISETQVRVAADIEQRVAQAKNRPEWMKSCVEDALTEIIRKEAVLTHQFTKSEDVLRFFGPLGSYVWKEHIESESKETVIRELDYRVAAGSTSKPNKEKHAANFRELMQYLGPVYQQYAMTTGDSDPLNGFLEGFGDAIEFDMTKLKLGPWAPPPPPPGTPDPAQQEMELKAQEAQMEMQIKQAEVEQETEQDSVKHQQELEQKEELHAQKLRHLEEDHAEEIEREREEHEEALQEQAEKHDAEVRGLLAKGQVQLEVMEEQSEAKVDSIKKQANVQAARQDNSRSD